MLNCLAVGAGGFIGAAARYLIGLIRVREDLNFPVKTLAINIVGSFVIGLIAAYALKNHDADPRLILFLKVGICGGFTTFSSFALESVQLMQMSRFLSAAAYIVLSVVLSLLTAAAAQMLVR